MVLLSSSLECSYYSPTAYRRDLHTQLSRLFPHGLFSFLALSTVGILILSTPLQPAYITMGLIVLSIKQVMNTTDTINTTTAALITIPFFPILQLITQAMISSHARRRNRVLPRKL
ncbi:hypothetical protein CFRS1_v014949 [Colletotrichum fructicola]|nr:hypothetical protein CFRS1_v014949 [Colletotrichum fructicola]